MPDTPRSLSYLLGTSFVAGQVGGIGSDDLRDFASSMPLWDDPANASGLGAPAILRGTVSTYNLSGLTGGSGLSTAARTANATALQNAINYAASNTKWFEFDRAGYEIYTSAGLVVPATSWGGHGFHWRGYGGGITQFYTNAPVITFGDPSGSASATGFDVDGCFVSYGSDQTGQTNANAIQLGPLWLSKFSHLGADAGGGFAPYVGLKVISSGSGGFFSNQVSDMYFSGCQTNMINIANESTQNIWQRIHMQQGGSTPGAIGGPALVISAGGGSGTGTVFDGINIEHCLFPSSAAVQLNGTRGIMFRNIHFEDNGGAWTVFQLIDANVNIVGMDMYNHRYNSSDSLAGTQYVFTPYYNCSIDIDGLLIQWTSSGCVNLPFQIFAPGQSIEFPPCYTMRRLQVNDFGGNSIQSQMSLDPNMGATDYPQPAMIDNYRYSPFYSSIEGAVTFLGDQSFTHYGQSKNAFLWFPASLAADRTLTLSNNMRSTSPGASVPRMVGDSVMVWRGDGTASHSLLVKNGAGTTLTTNTTSSTNYTYVYNGTNFVTVT